MSTPFSFPPPPPPPPQNNSSTPGHPPVGPVRGNRGGLGYNGRGRNNAARGGRGNRNYGMHGHSDGNHGNFAPNTGRGNQLNRSQFPGGNDYQNRDHSSNKRKRDFDTAGQQPSRAPQQRGSGPDSSVGHRRNPQLPVAPSVPSFGAPLLSPHTSAPTPSYGKHKAHNQPHRGRPNRLGLAPTADKYSESEEEDYDEEAAYQSAGPAGHCTFEHNGVTYSLSSPAEIAAWIKERKKNFPTAARIKQKQEAEERQHAANERVRQAAREADAQIKKPASDGNPRSKPSPRKEHPGKAQRRTQGQSASAPGPAKELPEKSNTAPAANVQFSSKLGIDYSSDSNNPGAASDDGKSVSSVLSSSSVVSSDSESENESSDSDGPPTEKPIKAPQAVRVAPPKRQQKPKETAPRICKIFLKTGNCPKGKKCRDQHTIDKGRRSLYQQLVEQEKRKDDLLTIQAVIALGKTGFFEEV